MPVLKPLPLHLGICQWTPKHSPVGDINPACHGKDSAYFTTGATTGASHEDSFCLHKIKDAQHKATPQAIVL